MSAPILVVQHAASEGLGLLADPLEGSGRVVAVRRTWKGDPIPRSAAGLAALIVMGGPMGVYDAGRFPHLADEIALAADALARGLPLLGVCLGAQILAAAAGARVYPGPGKEIGWFPVTLGEEGCRDPVLAPLAPEAMVFHWHGDTFDLPRGAVLLASSEKFLHQAFRIGPRAHGVQFHPEVTAGMVDLLLEAGAAEATDFGGEEGAARIRAEARRYAADLVPRARAVAGAFLTAGGLA